MRVTDACEMRSKSARTAFDSGDRIATISGLVLIVDIVLGIIDIEFNNAKNIAPVMAIGSLAAIFFWLGFSQMRNSNDL